VARWLVCVRPGGVSVYQASRRIGLVAVAVMVCARCVLGRARVVAAVNVCGGGRLMDRAFDTSPDRVALFSLLGGLCGAGLLEHLVGLVRSEHELAGRCGWSRCTAYALDMSEVSGWGSALRSILGHV
jgi:hypothetical protein